MKLSDQHGDRIDSIKWFAEELEEHAKEETARGDVRVLLELAANLASGIVLFAADDADGGRITSAIDHVRHAIEDLISAHHISKAKANRIEAAKPAAVAAEPTAQ
jgi:hypothetical protein